MSTLGVLSPKYLGRSMDDGLSMRVQGVSLSDRREVTPSSSNTSREDEEDRDPFGVVESIMGVNRMLEKQIEALRLRVGVEAKHHAIEKSKIVSEKDTVISKKSSEIEDLHDEIHQRDAKISELESEASKNSNLIDSKCQEVDKLRELIRQAEDYTKRLHKHSETMRGSRGFANRDDLVKFQKDELNRLKEELSALKQKVGILERELLQARDMIEAQGKKISQLDGEKNGLSVKFKDELDKATRAMRQEVERMREVMKNQWEEMKTLREQNQDIHDDVKMIRTLLVDQATAVAGGDNSGSRTPKTPSVLPEPTRTLKTPSVLQEPTRSSSKTPSVLVHEPSHPPVDVNRVKYKLEEHEKYVLSNTKKQDTSYGKPHTPGIPAKSRLPVNRPTVSRSPRLGVSPSKVHNHPVKMSTNTRSSSVLSGRGRQSTEANLPPITSAQRQPTGIGAGGEHAQHGTSGCTRHACGINSAKQSYAANRRK